MRKLILLLTLFITSFSGYGQGIDTLYTNDYRATADLLYGALIPRFHEGSLINRSIEISESSLSQVFGNYSQIHDTYSWCVMYDDVAISYFDTNQVNTSVSMAKQIENSFNDFDAMDDDELRQPFALLYHELSAIDSSFFNDDYFDVVNHQFVVKNGVNESSLYNKVTLKSASILEFYADNGYEEGKLVYDEKFISTSPNIEINSLLISINNQRFQLFDENNHEIMYSRLEDSVIARVAINFTKQGLMQSDTLSFYLTTNSGFSENDFTEKSSRSPWDDTYTWKRPEMDFRVAIKYGCGNQEKIMRPIIIVPPYRPKSQPVHMNWYYNQFDFKSLLFSLTEMGYDVIFIKEKPGNMSISTAGSVLAEFIKAINETKSANFPNANFETIVMGFSAGGQHARYALMKLEKEHMEQGGPHHHTRLYIPFDSPHLGANVPMFTQAVYNEHKFMGVISYLAWSSLNDAASKDMIMNHYTGSNPSFNSNNDTYSLISGPTSSRTNLVNQFNNSFTHAYTNSNDLRKSFPSFSRNISVSTGRNDQDYNSEFGLIPGMLLFQQNIFLPSVFPPGLKVRKRDLRASNGAVQNDVYRRDDLTVVGFLVPIVKRATYRVSDINSYNWDMAQGGYKNEFYDKSPGGIIPIAPVPLLRLSGAWMLGNKIYDNNMNFLPLISAFNINPDIWSGNSDVFYDVKEEGLMFNSYQNLDDNIESDLFGYPHLGNPTNHFNITPFESIYADPQTYEHIKMKASVMEQDLELEYLVHLRNFILDEVEADIVGLQNQVIGENHVQDPNYKYRAWYKADKELHIGHEVTPKTNKGDYVIEETGNITVYAGEKVVMKPGFHAKAGSKFHAFIKEPECEVSNKSMLSTNNNENTEEQINSKSPANMLDTEKQKENKKVKVYPNPNNGTFTLEVTDSYLDGEMMLFDTYGKMLYLETVKQNKMQIMRSLDRGVYYVTVINGSHKHVEKIVVQ